MQILKLFLLLAPFVVAFDHKTDGGRRLENSNERALKTIRGEPNRLLKTGGGKGDSSSSSSSKGGKGKGKGGSSSSSSSSSKGGKGKGKGGSSKSPAGKGKGGSSKSPAGKGKGKGGSSKSPKGKGKGKGKGGSSKSPKGKGKGSGNGCTALPIFFVNSEVVAGEFEKAIGFGLQNVPFYSAETGEQLGLYNDFAVEMPAGDECVANGVFGWEQDAETGLFGSTINIAFSCNSEYNTIVGGTGGTGCATGYEEFNFVDDEILATTLYFCGSTCEPKA